MAHPFGSPNSSRNPYNGSAEFEGSRRFGRSRVFLVAIHGGVLPPIVQERSPMQRMRVVVLSSNRASEFDSADLLPGGFRHALPPMPSAPPVPQEKRLQPRPVRGEILRGQEGHLYEKVGEQIRPLHKLVSGSRGQVLELVPSQQPISEITVPADSDEPSVESPPAQSAIPPYSHRQRQQNGKLTSAAPAAALAAENPRPAPYRKFFPDPGQGRVIRLGDFKALLAPQLANPERLRDTHRLACYLQVYEATTAQRLESLAASVLGDAGRVSQLQPMTEHITHQLGLTSLLRIRPRVPGNFPREVGLLLPYERVFRLQLAQDPTADDVAPIERQAAMNFPMKDPFTSGDVQRPAPAQGPGLKNVIPERYIKPWEFKLSRDEALYDMNVKATFASWFSSLNMRLKGWMSDRGELKKWQILLSGKNADEQLWAVRPPKRGLSHPAIRDWACKTLETAGYNPQTMLLEWEIFWRRKGL
jgi:hypothetical protein